MKIFSGLIIFILFACTFGECAERFESQDVGYRLEADVIYGRDNVSFTAEGNVVVTFKNSQMKADRATYYPQTRSIEAEGNVVIVDDLQELVAERVTYYLETETGIIQEATGVIAGEYYICAASLTRMSKEYYIFEGARVTTCSGVVPDWSFRMSRGSARMEGYLIGDHTTANIKKVPVFYSPKMVVPLKTQRQSGLLIPSMGQQSRIGEFYTQKFFWAIDYDKDMTFGGAYLSDRGFMPSIEARYVISPDSRIYFASNLLDDRHTTAEVDGRWRYTSKSIVNLPYDLQIVADADMVSDYMYMRDFYRFNMYDPASKNRENVYYQQFHLKWDTRFGEFLLSNRNDFIYRDTTSGYRKTLLAKEPELSLRSDYNSLGPVKYDYYFAWNNISYRVDNYNFNSGRTKTNFDYKRVDASGSLYKSFNMQLFSITPSFTLHYTRFYDFSDDINAKNHTKNALSFVRKQGSGYDRLMPEYKVTMNLNEIFKYYGDNNTSKHSIANTIEYVYVPEINQSGLPNYDEDEIVEGKNVINWILQSYYRTPVWNFRVKAEQGFDLDNVDGEILVPLILKVNVSRTEYFSNTSEILYDYYYYKNDTNTTPVKKLENTLSLRYQKNYFKTVYKYYRDVTTYNTSLEVTGGFSYKNIDVYDTVTWRGTNKFMSFAQVVPMKNEVGVVWNSQCWSFGISFESEKYTKTSSSNRRLVRDNTLELTITLRGIGDGTVQVYDETMYY